MLQDRIIYTIRHRKALQSAIKEHQEGLFHGIVPPSPPLPPLPRSLRSEAEDMYRLRGTCLEMPIKSRGSKTESECEHALGAPYEPRRNESIRSGVCAGIER